MTLYGRLIRGEQEQENHVYRRIVEILGKIRLSDEEMQFAMACAQAHYEQHHEEGAANTPRWVSDLDCSPREHMDSIRVVLHELLLSKWGRELGPIQAVAKGMKNFANGLRCRDGQWQTLRGRNLQQVIQDIQGTFDREALANAIQASGWSRVLRQKRDWLRQWIRNDATVLELRQFIRYVSGTSALPAGRNITLTPGRHQPFPSASSCFLNLQTSSQFCTVDRFTDSTYEGFIETLRMAFEEPDGYTQG